MFFFVIFANYSSRFIIREGIKYLVHTSLIILKVVVKQEKLKKPGEVFLEKQRNLFISLKFVQNRLQEQMDLSHQ